MSYISASDYYAVHVTSVDSKTVERDTIATSVTSQKTVSSLTFLILEVHDPHLGHDS